MNQQEPTLDSICDFIIVLTQISAHSLSLMWTDKTNVFNSRTLRGMLIAERSKLNAYQRAIISQFADSLEGHDDLDAQKLLVDNMDAIKRRLQNKRTEAIEILAAIVALGEGSFANGGLMRSDLADLIDDFSSCDGCPCPRQAIGSGLKLTKLRFDELSFDSIEITAASFSYYLRAYHLPDVSAFIGRKDSLKCDEDHKYCDMPQFMLPTPARFG